MLTILDYANHFGFKMIVGTSEAIKREIKTVEIDRPGLELTGFFDYHQKDRLVLLGNKEFAYIATLSDEQQENVLTNFVTTVCQELSFVKITSVQEC